MAKTKEDKEKKGKIVQLSPQDIIASYIDKNDDEGVNEDYKKANNQYKISSGSIKFDKKTDGGLGPGIVRLIGPTETGKTSQALTFTKNFLEKIPNSIAIYFKVEGRLSQNMIKRNAIEKYIEDGRFQVMLGRSCSFVFGMMKDLIMKTTGINYVFIVDSVDALRDGTAKDKGVEGKLQPGGGGVPMILSQILPDVSNAMETYGHLCFMLSQHRDQITIGHQKKTKNIEASGGNALLHYPNWTFEYEIVRNGDVIFEEEEEAKNVDDKEKKAMQKAIGHVARVVVKKSMNETTLETIHYPIKRGAKPGKSIWTIKEVYDILLMFGLIKKKGGWFEITEPVMEKYKEANPESAEIPAKIHGEPKLWSLLEENLDFVKFMLTEFKELGILHEDQDIDVYVKNLS